MAKVKIDTDLVKNRANVIESNIQDLKSSLSKIDIEIQDLNVSWKGKSSESFNKKIEEQKQVFERLIKISNDYTDHIKRSVQRYEDFENEHQNMMR